MFCLEEYYMMFINYKINMNKTLKNFKKKVSKILIDLMYFSRIRLTQLKDHNLEKYNDRYF